MAFWTFEVVLKHLPVSFTQRSASVNEKGVLSLGGLLGCLGDRCSESEPVL